VYSFNEVEPPELGRRTLKFTGKRMSEIIFSEIEAAASWEILPYESARSEWAE
jgi:hypothetical protein